MGTGGTPHPTPTGKAETFQERGFHPGLPPKCLLVPFIACCGMPLPCRTPPFYTLLPALYARHAPCRFKLLPLHTESDAIFYDSSGWRHLNCSATMCLAPIHTTFLFYPVKEADPSLFSSVYLLPYIYFFYIPHLPEKKRATLPSSRRRFTGRRTVPSGLIPSLFSGMVCCPTLWGTLL